MSELNLSLYQIDQQLTELWGMRDEVEESLVLAIADGDTETVDRLRQEAQALEDAMVLYFAALPKKVDSTGDAWAMLERLCGEPKERKGQKVYCELDLEIMRLKERRDALRKRLESLKTRVQFVMEGMHWADGKPRKLEGVRHTLYLKGNGGRPAVEVYDETLVPDELCTVTVTMNAVVWAAICGEESIADCRVARVPSLSLISSRLSEACQGCEGRGHQRDPVFEEHVSPDTCSECGGSGKASVPGARLKPVGEHVECK